MTSSKAIEALQGAFAGDQLALPGSDEFTKLNKSYLSCLQSDITPAAIFLPKTKDDVAKFVSAVKPFALSGDAPFAIRGAGQQPVPGCSNAANGITLDLRHLKGIELKEGAVSVGAGERWGPIYEKVSEQGLGVSGSRSALGGVGGLALAGGLSFFSTREGFITDTVTNFEVVLASGEIVNANAQENSDLWIALRGGGNNFGVVTRYELRTFKQGPFWGGTVFYFPPSFPSQIDALVHELKKPDASDETHIMISAGYSVAYGPDAGTMCLNQVYYTREEEKPAVLEPFVTMQPQLDGLGSMRMMNLKDAAGEQAQMSSDGIRCAYMNTTVKADSATLTAAFDTYIAALEPLKKLEGITASLTLQAYPVSLMKKSIESGGNSLGLDPADGPLVSVLALTWWKSKDDDKQIIDAFKGVMDTVDKDAASRGTSVPFKYMNYAYDFQNPIASYGAENEQKLKEVSKKYDPESLFQKGVPGGFKLGL